jgi:tripartite ATP-independent transporter DctP family solute receptor
MVPVAAINGIAFAFPTYADVWMAMDGELGAYLRASIEKTGLVVFDKIFDNGYRQITSGTKPINTPADLQGFKIRVPGAALWVSMFKGLGASPTTINFSEVYSALQTKIVDGQETPLVTIDSAKLYEVQKYCAMSNHMWDGFYFLANRKSLAKLPEDLQKLVRDTMNAVALQERDDSAKQAVALKSQLEKKGLVFNSTDPAQFRDTLRKAGFYVEWQKTFGQEAWGLLEKTAGKLT